MAWTPPRRPPVLRMPPKPVKPSPVHRSVPAKPLPWWQYLSLLAASGAVSAGAAWIAGPLGVAAIPVVIFILAYLRDRADAEAPAAPLVLGPPLEEFEAWDDAYNDAILNGSERPEAVAYADEKTRPRTDAWRVANTLTTSDEQRESANDAYRHLLHKARDILDSAQNEQRALTPNERRRWEAFRQKADRLREQQEVLNTVQTWQGFYPLRKSVENARVFYPFPNNVLRDARGRLIPDVRRFWVEFYDGNRRASPRIPLKARVREDGLDAVEEVSWDADHRCTLDGTRVWDAEVGGMCIGTPKLDGPRLLREGDRFTLTSLEVNIDVAA